MSSTDNNKQDDTNVFRVEDIVPPYNKERNCAQDLPTMKAGQRKDVPSQNGQDQTLKEVVPPLFTSQVEHTENAATESAGVVRKSSEIPKFDLAEQIMAEQRKITAIRRKAPGQKTKAPDQRPRIESTGYAIEPPRPTLSERDLIIAEIVARDIEKLYRDGCSSVRDW